MAHTRIAPSVSCGRTPFEPGEMMTIAENLVGTEPNSDRSTTSDSEHRRLFEIIREHSFRYTPNAPIQLASGRKSPLYFNMKATMLDPEGGLLCAHEVFEKVKGLEPDFIGGLEMGAVPIVSSVCAFSYASGKPIPSFFVRKKEKVHGTRSLIEGLKDGQTLNGKHVVMVDDVTTTGGSVAKAVNTARAEGAIVKFVVALVDREEGAKEELASIGVTLISVFSASEFVKRSES